MSRPFLRSLIPAACALAALSWIPAARAAAPATAPASRTGLRTRPAANRQEPFPALPGLVGEVRRRVLAAENVQIVQLQKEITAAQDRTQKQKLVADMRALQERRAKVTDEWVRERIAEKIDTVSSEALAAYRKQQLDPLDEEITRERESMRTAKTADARTQSREALAAATRKKALLTNKSDTMIAADILMAANVCDPGQLANK